MGKLQYKVLKKVGKARLGEITLNGVKLQTPVFMPVGTKATIKGLILDMLKDPKYIGNNTPIQLILANTFHLYLRPGDELIKNAGGLHKFENWDKLILTDSGGFQVFSLGLGKDKSQSLVKLQEDGVWFKSPYDGGKHLFTPQKVVDIQTNLGSDIMMVLDVCSPTENISKSEVNKQMQMTHKWADKAFEYFLPKYDEIRGVLFPIVQGGLHDDLRQESAAFLSKYAIDGIAIGGLSVGESHEDMYNVIDTVVDILPQDKPRYFMGLGTPNEIRNCIYKGIDMFDCVLPTRLGRHGTAFSNHGNIKLGNAQYKNDFSKLDEKCNCFTCQTFTKAYLHHLVRENEMLGGILLSLHNISFLHNLVEDIKQELLDQ
ncbi:MAG: tRNA guanosine(34) transglycosylase Tgt [Candidatus Absconditabacteria bacterium]